MCSLSTNHLVELDAVLRHALVGLIWSDGAEGTTHAGRGHGHAVDVGCVDPSEAGNYC